MPEVTSEQVASYEAACRALARRYVGRNGADLDDLVQEGRILVWQSLQRGVHPAADMIENRMRSYVRWLGRQYPVPYEAMLPLDDIAGATALDGASSLR